uniref:thiol oxidase n=1 Tax=viral metagenome TaxID=1070528 RepID=A0A6C0CRX2_9ZZZZ
MGISPDIWGPNAWTFIHLMVISEHESFDIGRLTYYQQFYEVLTHLLPCEKCRNHLIENLKKNKDLSTIRTKKELFKWTVDLHNAVNLILNKSIWDTEKAYTHWTAVANGEITVFGKECPKNQWKYIAWTCMLIIVLLVFIGKVPRKK